MVKSFAFLLVCLYAFSNLNAQEKVLSSELYPELKYYALSGEVFYSDYKQVKGSAFLDDDWMQGNIYFDNGEEIPSVQLKLDIFMHRVLVYQENLKRIVITSKEDMTGFTVGAEGSEKQFKKIAGINSKAKASDGCFFEVLHEGEISLFKLYYIEKLPFKYQSGIFTEEFYNETDYFIKVNNEYNEIRLRRRYFIGNFPEYKSQIRQFIRKNRLKPGNENDFVKVLNYLSEIS
ncbi:MAG: hypothetical protein PVF73_00580 [Bacteroidales bacterium]|jgi:hypothetical protein